MQMCLMKDEDKVLNVIFVTARVRSTREGTVFTGVCLLTFGEGRVPHPRSGWWGGYPIPGLGCGVPHPRGVPQPGMDGTGYPIPGGYPGQVLMVGGTQGTPPTPGLDGGGYPGYTPAWSGWWGGYPEYPPPWNGVPPQTWDGIPPLPSRPGWGTPHPGMGSLPPLDRAA